MDETKNTQPYIIPGAIIIAGLIIAGAIVFSDGDLPLLGSGGEKRDGTLSNNNTDIAKNVRAIDGDDHIRGRADAKVVFVEYSDFECPFCRQFHPTLERITEEYTDVAWVYRHFPLTASHPHALGASIASECVAELAGNDAFWVFADSLFENQTDLNTSFYVSRAQELHIDTEAFNECINSERHLERIRADAQNAVDSGGQGTPFNVLVTSRGEVFPFSGALPYEQVKQIVNTALQD